MLFRSPNLPLIAFISVREIWPHSLKSPQVNPNNSSGCSGCCSVIYQVNEPQGSKNLTQAFTSRSSLSDSPVLCHWDCNFSANGAGRYSNIWAPQDRHLNKSGDSPEGKSGSCFVLRLQMWQNCLTKGIVVNNVYTSLDRSV